ncbi:MAG TPA: alkaline phosphatase family protein, partial [Thermoanaerobaculia bacterium]|nr:alkaline phosphatase family protein [Thermoanaerobaculia bacterium]
MPEPIAPIQNIVVVMLENRSYDNVLGVIGGSGRNGLTGTESNVDPYTSEPVTVHEAESNQIGGSGQTYQATMLPVIDPNELFGDMAQQYLGDPAATTPYDGYTTADGTMSGYMANYKSAREMSEDNIGDVMTYLTAQQLPVTSFLATNFAVCDQWFASVPSQTFVNRIFALCAAPQIANTSAPYSVVNDLDHLVDILTLLPASDVLETATILDQLDAAGQSWKLYFHDYSIAMLTIPYVATNPGNVSTFDNSDWGSSKPFQLPAAPASTFVDDVANGTLPPFSFIEPRYATNFVEVANQLPPNSNHPGAANFPASKDPDPSKPPIDA